MSTKTWKITKQKSVDVQTLKEEFDVCENATLFYGRYVHKITPAKTTILFMSVNKLKRRWSADSVSVAQS